jgi:hypothetical protein
MSKYSTQELAAMAAARPRRVIPVADRIEVTGTDECLGCWKEWMGRNDTDLGVKSQSTLKGDGDGYGSADSSQARRDNEIAEATDAMIRSLQRSHQWAIRIQMGVAGMKVWTFPNLDYIAEAQHARNALEKLLKNNIATRLLFG